MDVSYGTSSFDRDRGNFPELPLINMFVESVPTEPSPVIISRPGITLTNTPNLGGGTFGIKIHGMFNTDGVLSNEIYTVTSDNTLYKNNTSLGSINGTGPVSWGAYSNYVFVTSGSSLYSYDGATLATVATPGSFSVRAMCVGASHIIAISANTGKFYWSDALSTTIQSLSFATAEQSPDKLIDCLFIGDTLVLFGTETVELWPSTGNATSPFEPLPGKTFPIGCRETACTTKFNGGFVWITNKNNICFNSPDQLLSAPWIEEKLALSTAAHLWTFWLEGTEFLAVRTDTQTFIYNAKSQSWSEFQSSGGNWPVHAYAKNTFGAAATGTYFQWLDESYNVGAYGGDSGTTTFERRFRIGTPITTGNLKVDNLTLRVNEGYTLAYSAGKPLDFQTPQVELRTSRDGGNTWSAWKMKSLGANGVYRPFPTWRSLGMFGVPGFMAEVRVTKRVPFRVSGAKINEPYGSR